MEKFIVVVPVMEYTLNLHQITDDQYTFFKHKDDLRLLDKKIINGRYKIFVENKELGPSQTKLFICTLVDAINENDAYKEGVKNISELINSMSLLFLTGFYPLYHEAIAEVLFEENNIKIDSVNLEITERGNIAKIISSDGEWTLHSPLYVYIDGDKRISKCITIPKAGQHIDGTAIVINKEDLIELENGLHKINLVREKHNSGLINVIAGLYNSAITTEDLSIAYLLLWQILETLASGKNDNKNKLVKADDIEKIGTLLADSDKEYIKRIKGALSSLKVKGDVQIITEILKENVFVDKNGEDIKKIVESARAMRGSIVHANNIDSGKLQSKYKELRDIIEKLFKKLKEI